MTSATIPFVPLWCATNHSYLRGASHPDELVQQAAAYGYQQLAITDRDSMAGVVEAWVATRALPEGHHCSLIIGAEVTVRGTGGDERAGGTVGTGRTERTGGDERFQVLLLARDREGYGAITQLISVGRLRSPKGQSEVFLSELATMPSERVIMIWHAESGGEPDLRTVLATWYGGAWIGVSRHQRPADDRAEEWLLTLARACALPVVAVPQVRYHLAERRHLHDVMTCIRHGTTLDAAGDLLSAGGGFALPTPAEVAHIYADHPEWVRETVRIAELCTVPLTEIRYRYPGEGRPDGLTDIQWLRRRTMWGARQRYPQGAPPEIVRQLDRELALIEELEYSGYFLTMAEIVSYCHEHGILCQGRGSAANSVVCYCLGITAIDPVRMNLLFERFISRERAEPPDIDLDIEHRRREEVIQHVYDRYGREHAAMVANIVRFRRRSAVREVGKVFGFETVTIDQLTRLLSHRGLPVAEALEQTGLDAAQPRVQAFLAMVEQIIGMPRHLSIHPGGFLLGQDPIAQIVPIENASMVDRTVIQWDKHGVEDMGLFKVDLLGLGALTHLDYAFRLLHDHLGVTINMSSIPMQSAQTYEMIRRGDTVGVFQLESRAQMAMLPRLRPREFYDLVVEISIVRPGPITGGMVHPYLRRRRGEEPVEYPHPNLEPILAKTLGVPLFQEQVMKLAMVAADYTPGEADQLRRDMAAWRQTGRIEQHERRIIERMTAHGIERDFAERVFEQIRGFGEYGFPESHAASFALIAWCTAWVRAHYPVIFTCALLNAWPMGFYSPATIVADARRHGIALRPVDVLQSAWECTLEPLETGGHAIRMGLRFVSGLGHAVGERIVAVQRSRQWQRGELRRFMAAAELHEDVRTALARVGAFRSLEATRRSAAWAAMESPARQRSYEASLLDAALGNGGDRETVPPFPPLDSAEALAWDYLVAGHSTTAHPLEPNREWLARHAYPTADELAHGNDGEIVSYIGMVICRQRPDTAGGTVFMTLEDETGFVNLVIWQDRFETLRTVLITSSILGVRGTVQRAEGVVHLVVRDAWHAALPAQSVATGSRDFH